MLADKAYGAGVNRRLLRERGIKAVIPEKSDQITARKRKGSAGAARRRAREAMARHRHPLRQARHHLPRRRRPPRLPHLGWAALLGDMP
ncbi:hypothetical protein D8Y24_08840 [Agrococcus lahaulensis]|nr:hypothetical protein D8Y24_08840 [Agrococcus lahaulensis]